MLSDFTVLLIKTIGILFLGVVFFICHKFIERKLTYNIGLRSQTLVSKSFLADIIKLIFKQNITPINSVNSLFNIFPIIALVVSFLPLIFMPMSSGLFLDEKVYLIGSKYEVLFIIALLSVSQTSFLIVAWSSGNKRSLMNSVKILGQNLLYDIILILVIYALYFSYGSFNLLEIINTQNLELTSNIPRWGIILQPLGALIFFIGILFKSLISPFSATFGEIECTSDYLIEYSGINFLFLRFAYYFNRLSMITFFVLIYLGGFKVFYLNNITVETNNLSWYALESSIFLGKILLITAITIFLQWSVPKFKYAKLLFLIKKFLLPAAFLNIAITLFFRFFYEN